METTSITPLRKNSRKGKLYTRVEGIEVQLRELQRLSREELVSRCKVQRDAPGYVPSECLVYFVRACRTEASEVHFERLYKILAERVLRRLPSGESTDGKKLYLSPSLIRERAFGRFVEMLASDRNSYCENLDFFEVRFDRALAKLRLDAQKPVWREDKRSEPLELDEETGELSLKVERATASINPLYSAELDGSDYRLRLNAAIESLPTVQRTIIEMIQKNIPIDSTDPEATTIAKTLGKSEKTVRNYRDKAFAAIRSALKREEKQ